MVTRMRLALCWLTACGSSAAAVDATPPDAPATHALSMNDVSILLPLPTDIAKPVLMTLAGKPTPLMTQNLFISLIVASEDIAPKEGGIPTFDDFHVVSLRVDLCDRSTIGPCPDGADGRLRVILQPMYMSGGMILANDVAIHAFYPIPAAELASVVDELRGLAAIEDAPAGDPLEISPAAAAGNADYLAGVTALVNRFASADRLVRVTALGQESNSGAFGWFFGGYDIGPGGAVPMIIPLIEQTTQRAQLTGGDVTFNLTPGVDYPAGFLLALNGPLFAAATADQRYAAVEALTVLQNPLLHDAVDTQCAACHISTNLLPLRAMEVGVDPTTIAGHFTTTYNTTVSSIEGTDPRVVRGFGWAATYPAISQRVANDTAEVLTEIEHRFPAP